MKVSIPLEVAQGVERHLTVHFAADPEAVVPDCFGCHH